MAWAWAWPGPALWRWDNGWQHRAPWERGPGWGPWGWQGGRGGGRAEALRLPLRFAPVSRGAGEGSGAGVAAGGDVTRAGVVCVHGWQEVAGKKAVVVLLVDLTDASGTLMAKVR